MENTVYSFDRKSTFTAGDLVVLKSGSPVMTVRNSTSGKGDIQSVVTVDWFVGEENYTASFYEKQLLEAIISQPTPKKSK